MLDNIFIFWNKSSLRDSCRKLVSFFAPFVNFEVKMIYRFKNFDMTVLYYYENKYEQNASKEFNFIKWSIFINRFFIANLNFIRTSIKKQPFKFCLNLKINFYSNKLGPRQDMVEAREFILREFVNLNERPLQTIYSHWTCATGINLADL